MDPGVATGSAVVATQFEVPTSVPLGAYELRVIASGIASQPYSFNTFSGMSVVSTTPSNGAVVASALTSFEIAFNEAILAGTLQASDLAVNGVAATSVSLDVTGKIATFAYASSPMTTEGMQSLSMAAGAISGVSGSGNWAYNASFRFDSQTLAVASTVPAVGANFTIPATTFNYDVTFSEPVNPAKVAANNLVLSQGSVTAATVLPGNTTVRYTLTGFTAVGTVNISLPAGRLTDQFDNPAFTAFSAAYGINTGIAVTSTTPANGASVSTAPVAFVISFDRVVDVNSLQSSDLTVNGLPANSVVLDGTGTTATFSFTSSPVTVQGLQNMFLAANSVAATDGTQLAAVNLFFNYDSAVLAVSSTNPPPGSVLTLPGPFTLDVTFNEAIDVASVQVTDLQLAGIPGAAVSQASFLPGNQTVRFTIIGALSEGSLSVSIPANAIHDAFGNPAMAAFAADYVVDLASQPFAGSLAQATPAGSLIYDGQSSGIVSFSGDSDTHTLFLDSNQTITLVVTPTSAGLQPQVELLDSNDVVIGQGSASAAGQPAVLQTTSITGGNYAIRVQGMAGTLGNYGLRAILNAALESENIGGSSNDSISSAQSIDGSFLTLNSVTGLRRGAVLGGNSAVPANDYYSFTAIAGDQLTVVLKNQSGSGNSLFVEDGSGAVLATGSVLGTNFDLGVGNLQVPVGGTYYLHITGTAASSYSLTTVVNGLFSSEGNDTAANASELGSLGAMGFVGGTAANLTLNATDSGWYNQAGSHNSSIKNFIVGLNSSTTYRDYFVFNLSAVSESITSAQLQLGSPANGYNSVDPTETYELHDVSTAIPLLKATASTQTAIFNDLGTGAVFGAQTVTSANNGGLVTIDLNSDSLAALNAAIGSEFAFGGALNSISGTSNQSIFAFTNGSEVKRLVLGLGDPEDWYSVTLTSDQSSLSLYTSTPGDGSGAFSNTLDIRIELYDATGTTLIASGTLAGDGRNETLDAVGLTPGSAYKVKVTGQGGTRGEYVLNRQAATPQSDIVMGAVTAGGGSSVQISYEIRTAPANPFRLGFYTSNDGSFDGSDILASSWLLSSPADLSVGNHTVTLSLGTSAGQVALPGAGLALPSEDFYLLAVANDNAAATETSLSNNSSALSGIYHIARGDVVVMGTDGNNRILVNGTNQLQLTFDGLAVSYASTDVVAFDYYPHAGDDTVTGAGVSRPMNFYASSGTDLFTGGQSSSTLIGSRGNNAWMVTGSNAGSVNGTSFTRIGNLTGGTVDDTFSFVSGASLSGTLNGASGINTLDYSSFTTAVSVNLQTNTSNGLSRAFAGINVIRGGTGNNVLTAGGIANTWIIDGPNSGKVNDLQFSAFATLNGGASTDRFVFMPGSSVSKLDGKSGSDSLDYSAFAASATVNLQSKTASAVATTWTSIESAAGSGLNDTLVGANTNTVWALSGMNSGSAGSFAFAAFPNLTGGTSNDTFRFANEAQVTGNIDGKNGTNALDYAAYASALYVNLQTGKATGANSVANIRDIAGGLADDILVGDAAANTISGGGGRNLIVGRLGADRLTAGSAGDILIGGRTSFDANDAALSALMATWKDTTRSYAARVSAIQSGISYTDVTGSHLAALTTASVFDDQAADSLNGGAGTDWYFARTSGSNKDQVNNRANGETLTSI